VTAIRRLLGTLLQFPSAIAGLAIVVAMVLFALYALVTIPYPEAVRLWRGGEDVWSDNPRTVPPAWVNWWPGSNRPTTIRIDSATEPGIKTRESLDDDLDEVVIDFTIDYGFDGFPQEITLFFTATYDASRPNVTMTWTTPDGREVRMGNLTLRPSEAFRASQETRLERRLNGLPPEIGLFADPDDPSRPLKGTYGLRVEGLLFEEAADLDARLVVYGQVHGWAGTDHRRRDLGVALLWGAPIALAFGLLAAVGTIVTTMFIAAMGVWFGGWIDATIQRITEVNIILPFLPILIMVGTFYSRSIWVLLVVVVLLGIFSAGIKTYRAIFLQIKQAPYIEAARAYGAGNMRIIVRYMIPRIIPVLVPAFVSAVPSYVFLEASLAVLGLGDPVLPTWGKVINDAQANGALFRGHYFWVLQPAALLLVTGFGFALVGFALDRVFNPRLRDV
jgi:peptide/nickel transport system permease protein